MMFLHRLKERRLSAGAGPVDLVRHQELGENRPPNEAEGPSAVQPLLHDFGAEDVGRHQIGGELHPQGVEAHNDAQGLDKLRFGEPRDADQQAVAPGEEDGQRKVDDALLAEDHGADFLPRRRYALKGGVDLPGQRARLGSIDRAHYIVPVVTKPPAVSLSRSAH